MALAPCSLDGTGVDGDYYHGERLGLKVLDSNPEVFALLDGGLAGVEVAHKVEGPIPYARRKAVPQHKKLPVELCGCPWCQEWEPPLKSEEIQGYCEDLAEQLKRRASMAQPLIIWIRREATILPDGLSRCS